MKSKILDLNFAGDPQEVIEKYWETIEHYRSQGKTLPQIYTALSKRDGFEDSLSFASFKGHYYRRRNQKRSGEAPRGLPVREDISPSSRKAWSDKESNLSDGNQSAVTEAGSESKSSEESPEVSGSEKPSKKRRKIDFSVTLEEHQRLAASRFYK